MEQKSLNIMIGGEAGQGLVTIGELLLKSLVRQGYSVLVNQDYESRIRGGHNTFTIRTSDKVIRAPREKMDLLLALNQETVDLHKKEMENPHLIIANTKWKLDDMNILHVPFDLMAEEKFQNVAALGIMGELMGLDRETLSEAVENLFGKKKEEYAVKNKEALDKAWDWMARQGKHAFLNLPKADPTKKRILVHTHDAIALGAYSAGLKFYSFYPMSPSTNIAVSLARHMETMPVVIEQAEDEIAAVNMAIGASFAGAPAMSGTAGGGFALMVEGISLAGMTETPLVVVVAQRPGPATGLPTRTEQADLDFVLHAGHGEFPRAILAPADPTQAFHMTRKALFLAEKVQTPVFILSDQFLSDMYREVEPFDVDKLSQVKVGANPSDVEAPYKRYQVTDSGVSPRLLPGCSRSLVTADSDEHCEGGHITEEPGVRKTMVNKRQRKMDIIRSEAEPPHYEGESGADILLVCWGSTMGSVFDAAEMLRNRGIKASAMHFRQVWPLVTDDYIHYLKGARRVVTVENNNLGQFARLMRRESGFEIREKVLRYDGRPITPEYILRELKEI